MLFIKNYTSLEGEKFKVQLTKEENTCKVSLVIDENNSVDLITVAGDETTEKYDIVGNVHSTIERSLKYISNITNVLSTEDNKMVTQLLDEDATEISFFVKNKKTVIKDTKALPAGIGLLDGSEDKRFPRDMVAFILPKKDENGNDVDFRLSIDSRNIGDSSIVEDLQDYRIIVAFIKYPIWANLKFPVYGLLTDDASNEEKFAFKLGTRKGKSFVRNAIIDCDIKEASDYLAESAKARAEREKQGSRNRGNGNDRNRYNNNNGNRKSNNNNRNNGGKNYRK